MTPASNPATAAFALVTGASSGIGAIHTDRLAKRGRSVAPLFRPFVLSKLSLANRVVMAPMTRQMSPGGIPGPEVAAYYRRRAESGTGLIITEGTVVDDPASTMSVDIPNFYGPPLDGWLRDADPLHEGGGKIKPQPWHLGHARHPAKAPHAARLATTPEELAGFLAPLSTAGVDIFHCSQRRFWEPEFEGSDLNLAGWTKKLTGKPTVTVGSVALSGDAIGSLHGESSKATGIDDLLDRLERDEFDLVAVGRALLVDPAWARKVQEARYDELLPFEPAALATLS